PIMPGESIEINVSSEDFNNIQKLLRISDYLDVDDVEIIVRDIIFTDRSKWLSGRFVSLDGHQTRAPTIKNASLITNSVFRKIGFVSNKVPLEYICGVAA